MRVLGIDPGSHITGFAVLDNCDRSLVYVDSGVVRLNGALEFRLHQLSQAIDEIVNEYQPESAAIETAFMHRNARALMVLCHARGVILQSVVKHQVPITHYEPKLVKKTVVGTGGAKKGQVGFMVQHLLNIKRTLAEDAADAAAVAITHLHCMQKKEEV